MCRHKGSRCSPACDRLRSGKTLRGQRIADTLNEEGTMTEEMRKKEFFRKILALGILAGTIVTVSATMVATILIEF
jgi:hypothetical protein